MVHKDISVQQPYLCHSMYTICMYMCSGVTTIQVGMTFIPLLKVVFQSSSNMFLPADISSKARWTEILKTIIWSLKNCDLACKHIMTGLFQMMLYIFLVISHLLGLAVSKAVINNSPICLLELSVRIFF